MGEIQIDRDGNIVGFRNIKVVSVEDLKFGEVSIKLDREVLKLHSEALKSVLDSRKNYLFN